MKANYQSLCAWLQWRLLADGTLLLCNLEFHTPVELTVLFRVICKHRPCSAKTLSDNSFFGDALGNQILPDRLDAFFGKIEVRFWISPSIGVAFQLYFYGFVILHDPDEAVEFGI